MRNESMMCRFEHERKELERSGTLTERLPHLTRRSALDRSWRTVEWTQLSEGRAQEQIEAEIEHSHDLPEGWEWKVYGTDLPSDLLDRLSDRGFQIGPGETTLGFDLNELKESPVTESGLNVRAIQTEDDLASFRKIAETLFRKDFAYSTGHLRQGLGKARPVHQGFLALLDRQPIAIGCLNMSEGSAFGFLYCGGTLPEFRGKGAYRALVSARAMAARYLGFQYLMIDALPTSEPIVRGLGFQELTKTWPCTWPPAQKAN